MTNEENSADILLERRFEFMVLGSLLSYVEVMQSS